MVTASEIRDLWEAELREEAERLVEPEPQPWEELAYMRWHLLRTDIPVIKSGPGTDMAVERPSPGRRHVRPAEASTIPDHRRHGPGAAGQLAGQQSDRTT